MMEVGTIGFNLAKNVFEADSASATGMLVLQKKLDALRISLYLQRSTHVSS